MSASFSKNNKKDPQEDIIKLSKIISNGDFSPVHLLFGTEDYLRFQFRDRLLDALGVVPGTLSFNRFSGKEVDPSEIIGLAETLPFLSDRRVILIEDTGWFKSGNEDISEYISSGICDTTVIIFSEREIDRRKSITKAVSEKGLISEFMTQKPETLVTWIVSRFRDAGLTISSSDASYMISLVGLNMVSLSVEADKLTSYCMDRKKVVRSDIDEICTRMVEDRIFEMCENVALGRKKQALSQYYDLIALKEKPVYILVMLERHYDTLLKIREMDIRRHADSEIAEAVGHPSWTLKKYRTQTSRYSTKELNGILELLADTDMSIKSGLITEDFGMEALMVRIMDR